MNWGQLDDYIESVSALKEKYKDQIEIHLGLESEYYTKTLEEKKYLRDWKMWISRLILVVFIASILFSFLSHYIRF